MTEQNIFAFLYENYMKPRKITVRFLSKKIGIDRARLAKLFDGRGIPKPEEVHAVRVFVETNEQKNIKNQNIDISPANQAMAKFLTDHLNKGLEV